MDKQINVVAGSTATLMIRKGMYRVFEVADCRKE